VKHFISEKLGAKLDKYKFMRYLKETIEYYLYHPVEKKVFVSKHVTFLKKKIVP
jgi:hypothetical protein